MLESTLRKSMKFNLNIDDIKYLKILYSNENGNPVSMKSAIKRVDDREITACVKYEDDFNISCPQQVTLSIVCSEGLYRTQTKLKSYRCDAPYISLYLETPDNFEFQQNREYFRVPVTLNCSYHVINNGQPAVFETKTFDISAGGLSIILPVHVFSEEDAEIEIKIAEKVIKAKIRYIRSERTDTGYKLSFKYTDISNRDTDLISQLCIQKQLEDKRNKSI